MKDIPPPLPRPPSPIEQDIEERLRGFLERPAPGGGG